jgi:hypothetical protein
MSSRNLNQMNDERTEEMQINELSYIENKSFYIIYRKNAKTRLRLL